MTDSEHLIQIAQLLEAETWVSDFVKRLASCSAEDGHLKFSADLRGFEIIVEDAVEAFKIEMVSALRLAGKYPDLFKDPFDTLATKPFEDK